MVISTVGRCMAWDSGTLYAESTLEDSSHDLMLNMFTTAEVLETAKAVACSEGVKRYMSIKLGVQIRYISRPRFLV
jgi:hypothetical protein